MIKYTVRKHHLPYTLSVELEFKAQSDYPVLQVPFWRPGRYEGGNFPKNFINLEAFSDEGGLKVLKKTSHEYRITAEMGMQIKVKYLCYAREMTAGNTYIDEQIVLINPVNTLVYVLGMEEMPATIDLDLGNWDVATAFPKKEGLFYAPDIQKLLDTPVLASPKLSTFSYEVNEVQFFVHFSGEINVANQNLVEDFKAFTRAQIDAFGGFPYDEYHFLIILLPHKTYHGVEHDNSTVIILGPSQELDGRKLYLDLMGVSSHELYHTWNVKFLRPRDWFPYDFTRNQFSRLGYIAEGITTYMGDRMLWEGGVFSDEEFFKEIANLFNRHMWNEGRFHHSLADSSVDTWVDGYGGGAPRRRVSIYAEGALLALICDIWLHRKTGGEANLSAVMRHLYKTFGNGEGLTEEAYWRTLNEFAEADWTAIKRDLVDGKGKLEQYVKEALDLIGLELFPTPSQSPFEGQFGARVEEVGTDSMVTLVFQNSPAEKAGVWFGDKILSVNGSSARAYFFSGEKSVPGPGTEIEVLSGFRKKTLVLNPDGNAYGQVWKLRLKEGAAGVNDWKGVKRMEA